MATSVAFWGRLARVACLLVVCGLAGFAPVVVADDDVVDITKIANNNFLSAYLRDVKAPPGARIEDVDRLARAGALQLLPGGGSRLFTAKGVVWMRLVLHNPETWPVERYLEIVQYQVPDVRLYSQGPSGEWQVMNTGAGIPISQRPVASRLHVFPLHFQAQETRTIYLRYEAAGKIRPLQRLWEPSAFYEHGLSVYFLNALQFGAILLFCVYALLLFANTRDMAFLWFGLLVAGCGGVDFANLEYARWYFWPDNAELTLIAADVAGVLVLCSTGFLVSGLLAAQVYLPRWNRLLRILSLAMLFTIPLRIFVGGNASAIMIAWGGLTIFTLSGIVTLLALVQRVPGVAAFASAFSLTWLTAIFRSLQMAGVLPAGWLVDYSMNWTLLFSGGLMIYAITQKLAALRAEHETARQATELERMGREMAEKSSAAKNLFLAHLSHELRTPLHSILGYSSLIQSSSTGLMRQRIRAVQRSGRHLLELIDELLDYARGEAGRLQLDARPTALHGLLESVVEDEREMAVASGISLKAVLADDLPAVVNVDGLRLRQVLINLVSNARRHSHGQEIRLEVSCQPGLGAGEVVLHIGVRDDGMGILPDQLQRIFEPFEQGVASEGVGLGLAISRQLVRLMGSDIVCESEPGQGAFFHFSLLTSRADPVLADALAGQAPIRRYAGPVRRLLVVDDLADNRALLADVLASMGFDLALAEDGQSALAQLEEGPFDLVLSDQLMPGMSGWDLLAAARQRGFRQPFVLLSAALPTPPAGWPEELAFAATLLKPAEPERLAQVLGDILGLAWQEEPLPPVPGMALSEPEAVVGVAAMVRPDADTMAHLAAAVREGRISDLEDRLQQIVADMPESRQFAMALQGALQRMDMATLFLLVAEEAHPEKPEGAV